MRPVSDPNRRYCLHVVPEERHPERLRGWLVIAVGRQQAWPIVEFADPKTDRHLRLFIDSAFTVTPGGQAEQHDATVYALLDPLVSLTVSDASLSDDNSLEVVAGNYLLRVQGDPNTLTTGSAWWLGALVE
jgi:hypothetical protein